jgi:hypothetical protein
MPIMAPKKRVYQRPRAKPLLRLTGTGDSHEMFTKRPKRMKIAPGAAGLDHDKLGTGLNVGGSKNPQQHPLGNLGA